MVKYIPLLFSWGGSAPCGARGLDGKHMLPACQRVLRLVVPVGGPLGILGPLRVALWGLQGPATDTAMTLLP